MRGGGKDRGEENAIRKGRGGKGMGREWEGRVEGKVGCRRFGS